MDNEVDNGGSEAARRSAADDAVRLAAKLAIDADDVERARALLDMLASRSTSNLPSNVAPLVVVRGKGSRQ